MERVAEGTHLVVATLALVGLGVELCLVLHTLNHVCELLGGWKRLWGVAAKVLDFEFDIVRDSAVQGYEAWMECYLVRVQWLGLRKIKLI